MIRKRIAIDVSSIPKNPAGIGMYILQLTKNIIKILDTDRYNLLLFGRNEQKEQKEFNGAQFVGCGNLGHLKRLFWEQTTLPLLCKQYGVDLLHSPNYVIPALGNFKKITTVHDLTCCLFPKRRKFFHGLYFRIMTGYAVRNADAIISVSYNTTQDIKKIYKVNGSTIHTIHLGTTDTISVPDKKHIINTLRTFSIGKPYFLFVGTLEPSKNLKRLIKAFYDFKDQSKNDIALVLAGKPGWGYKAIEELIECNRNESAILRIGYVGSEFLPSLFAGSIAFLYPSLYEGFGIPPLEAMACDTPVLCSNTSSIPEVVGDAALMFNPYNCTEITNALIKITQDEKLRSELIGKGKNRIKLFKWSKAAEKTIHIYCSLID